jgi:hypothetical protein
MTSAAVVGQNKVVPSGEGCGGFAHSIPEGRIRSPLLESVPLSQACGRTWCSECASAARVLLQDVSVCLGMAWHDIEENIQALLGKRLIGPPCRVHVVHRSVLYIEILVTTSVIRKTCCSCALRAGAGNGPNDTKVVKRN